MSHRAQTDGNLADSESHTFLKSLYDTYSDLVYSLCLRLLSNREAAESATIEVFVRFSHEQGYAPGDLQPAARLRELAIRTSIARLRRRGGKVIRRILCGLSARLL